MMRFVVEYHQFVDVADDDAEVHLAIRGCAAGPRPQEIIPRVLIVRRSNRLVAAIDAVDVRQEDVAGFANDAHLVLNVQRQLEIVAPVMAVVAVVRQYGIVEENAQSLEILIDAVQYNDVGSDNEKVARQRRIRLIKPMKETPGQHQT